MMPTLLLVAAAVLPPQTPSQPAPAPKPYQCTGAAHREFDFWLGEWDVVPNGQPLPPGSSPGRNVITKEYDGCVVLERWEGMGLKGSSFNIYDRSRGEWVQTWVDSAGGLHHYRGRLQDGNMVFLGDVPLPMNARFAGRRTIRLTFFRLGPDKVRQLSESLMPDGTWTVNYDLIYTRRPARQPHDAGRLPSRPVAR
jgi:hypothetical protein